MHLESKVHPPVSILSSHPAIFPDMFFHCIEASQIPEFNCLPGPKDPPVSISPGQDCQVYGPHLAHHMGEGSELRSTGLP